MFVQFTVMALGSAVFHSNKLNRDFQRARLIGFTHDAKGARLGGTADLDFDGSLSYVPKEGEDVLLDVTDLSSKSTLLELRFHSVEPLSARESKQK